MTLGFTPYAPNKTSKWQAMALPTTTTTTTTTTASKAKKAPIEPQEMVQEDEGTLFDCSCSNGSYTGLIILNFLLFIAHSTIAAIVATYDISFPVTVFETRLADTVLTNFTCIYNYGFDPSGGRWCETESAVPTQDFGNPGSCAATIAWYNSTSGALPATQSGGPLLSAYGLTRMGDNSSGVAATRWILFSISAVTAVFHIIYAIGFFRLSRNPSLLDFFVKAGGIPARWYEYAITASMMSFFISNLANVFEFYALLAFCLGTFALMYFGLQIEQELFAGRPGTSLKILYVPSMALFVLTWLPNVRQVGLDILKISCADTNPNIFSCTTKTCFGEENPIAVFVFILMGLFVVFPFITIEKIYSVGGYKAKLTSAATTALRRSLCVDTTPLMNIVYIPIVSTLKFTVFLTFALIIGPVIAVTRIASDILYPLVLSPSLLEQTVAPTATAKKNGFIWGEWLFVLASATSKLFLAIYFLIAFAQRNW